jgi:hypothetical protein
VGVLDNYSLVFVIFINFFGQLKDRVGKVHFLVSCPKGQVEKYVNVDACMATIFLSNRDEMRKCYRGPAIDASCKILLYLAGRFQSRRFLEIDQSETRIVNGSHVC